MFLSCRDDRLTTVHTQFMQRDLLQDMAEARGALRGVALNPISNMGARMCTADLICRRLQLIYIEFESGVRFNANSKSISKFIDRR